MFSRADDDVRGRHLVCEECIPTGTLIFTERPLAYLQSLGNTSDCQVCKHCYSFVSREGSATICQPAQSFQCRNRCGQLYCSALCEKLAWKTKGHDLLCTGLISESEAEEHPLIEFKIHAMQNNEIFLVVGEIVCTVTNLVRRGVSPTNADFPFTDFTGVPWWDVATHPLRSDPESSAEVEELDVALKFLCESSAKILLRHVRSVLGDDFPDSCLPYFTKDFFGKIIGTFEQNAIGVRLRNPIYDVLTDGEDFGLNKRKDIHEEILKVAIEARERDEARGCDGAECNSESDDDGDDRSEEEVEDSEAGVEVEALPQITADSSPEDVTELLAAASVHSSLYESSGFDSVFPPLDGTALFSTACKMNHSCIPNVFVQYRGGWGQQRPLVLECVAVRDIQPGEELCISYVDCDLDTEERRQELLNYGFFCECPRCEGKMEDMPALPADEDLFGCSDDDDDDDDDEVDGNEGGLESRVTVGPPKTPHELLAERIESDYQIPTAITNKTTAVLPSSFIPTVTYGRTVATIRGCLIKPFPAVLENYLCKLTAAIDNKKLRSMKIYAMLAAEMLWSKLGTPDFQRSLYQGCALASALALANESRFLEAMKFIDCILTMGFSRHLIEDLLQYIEPHAKSTRGSRNMVYFGLTETRNYVVPSYDEIEFEIKKPLPPRLVMSAGEASAPATKGALTDALMNDTPFLIKGYAKSWPATKIWRDLADLVVKYGHRTVPVELGSMNATSNVEESMMLVCDFVDRYLSKSTARGLWSLQDAIEGKSDIVYCAQHSLFDQIPELEKSLRGVSGLLGERVDVKVCNAWLGTGGTRTPMHYDSYENLFVQLVGCKYVRLVDHKSVDRSKLYLNKGEGAGAQGNMSEVDVENVDEKKHSDFKDVEFFEVLLMPGDVLYIPQGMFHYVRSLTTSFSASYWF